MFLATSPATAEAASAKKQLANKLVSRKVGQKQIRCALRALRTTPNDLVYSWCSRICGQVAPFFRGFLQSGPWYCNEL